jgi:hypothetical protein
MSGSGVFYTSDQINQMQSDINAAQTAEQAGDTQAVKNDVTAYYQLQESVR